MQTGYEEELNRVREYFRIASSELKTKNRFSNEKLDKVVRSLVNEKLNNEPLRKGSILYRARKYTEADAGNRFLYHSADVFQGYDEKGSFVNKAAPNEGRCNPQFIPYLYACNAPSCCISEIRPRIGEYISVAEIKITYPLNILSLATDCILSCGEPSLIPPIPDSTVILFLTDIFSKPYEENGDYLMTQYLAEKIKNEGYDGISFYSSVCADADRTNFTIFNYENCKPTSSKLCKIENVSVSYTFDPSEQKRTEEPLSEELLAKCF